MGSYYLKYLSAEKQHNIRIDKVDVQEIFNLTQISVWTWITKESFSTRISVEPNYIN